MIFTIQIPLFVCASNNRQGDTIRLHPRNRFTLDRSVHRQGTQSRPDSATDINHSMANCSQFNYRTAVNVFNWMGGPETSLARIRLTIR